MIEVKLHNPVANESRAWMYWWDGYEGVFSLEFVQSLFKNNPAEMDFKFNIHCPGGEVQEGLAIYDCLRTSGKNIYMNIEGDCHSMAVALLLAAPKENRSANPNCTALIHKVYGCAYSGTADELEAQAAETRMLQNKILDIYADRTDMSREELEAIMNKQIAHNASELLQWGFISKINSYNTNYQHTNKIVMNIKKLKEDAATLMNRIQSVLGGAAATNFEFVDADGAVLFTTEGESDALEVGMTASPDGTFTIADGRTVVIEGGKIVRIDEKPAEESNFEHKDADGNVLFTTEASDDDLEVGMKATPDGEFELPDGRIVIIVDGAISEIRETAIDTEEVQNLRAENETLRNLLSEARNLISELKKNVKSDYVPGNRIGSGANSNKGKNEQTREERKNAVKQALHPSK